MLPNLQQLFRGAALKQVSRRSARAALRRAWLEVRRFLRWRFGRPTD